MKATSSRSFRNPRSTGGLLSRFQSDLCILSAQFDGCLTVLAGANGHRSTVAGHHPPSRRLLNFMKESRS